MRKYIRIFYITLILLVPVMIWAQSNDRNYILTRTYTDKAGKVSQDQIQYFDGLGRPVQTVQRGVTPSKLDLVSLQEYDGFGRESNVWLPGTSSSNGGFVNPQNLKQNILNSTLYSSDQKPYSSPVYENSPLNRILEQYAPGADWHTNNKAVRTVYLTNIVGNDTLGCKLYNVTENLSLTNLKNYDTGELYVTRIEDEDGNASFEFKDKLGQVVLTRQLIRKNNSKILHDTYYLYDDFGNLCFVLPPRIQEEGITQAKLDELAYQYRYDHRNRCIWKKLPGVDPIYYAYDTADKLIFTQDGEQRTKGEWAFSIPDAFGRVVLTGTCKTVNNGSITTERFNNNLIKAEFSTSGIYMRYRLKLDNVDLTLKDYAVLTANYYDNYDFHDMTEIPSSNTVYTPQSDYGTWYAGDYTETNKYKNKGMLTGSLVAQMNANGTIGYLYSVMYYDNRGRLIQTKSNNHLKGTEEEYMAYNFTGQPVKKLHVHNGNNGSKINEKYTYIYDHAGRLKETRHRLNDSPHIMATINHYDELGRLESSSRNIYQEKSVNP
ncbi:DUF6443 domain-containing protein [Dysgonomonas sp. BGC7]|uniref:DUF6443 domain-containing protein n=1 Tax=Dysgonomonas sp. BGC7 TaxID=1658008 RepID=UPI000A433F08|nr:DUF6443 domain-containing protein [Dysgonomonas sp. BGC7]MBD8388717.1 hypothetical protein [Dysgonomonas sp. BGC7]